MDRGCADGRGASEEVIFKDFRFRFSPSAPAAPAVSFSSFLIWRFISPCVDVGSLIPKQEKCPSDPQNMQNKFALRKSKLFLHFTLKIPVCFALLQLMDL
ncbi:unnamed protein product [Sphagnum jensenii]|uniref:Uncharacterized protein n=1 Tax=Sphagnum jensenii TaxID=128206 RepID=A0ABP1BGV2_9BRYO